MKILLISDVHANLEALDQVLASVPYDQALFAGDAVDYGPSPFEVYSRLKQMRATRVLGNHDAAAAFGIDCRSSSQMHEASVVTRERITLPRMPKRALQALGKAEQRMDLDFNGLRIRMLHASPTDELYQYISKEDASRLEVRGVDLLVVGHTHIPYEVKNENVWVVNPGSVGMPKDGDPRASYAVLDTYTRKVRFGRVDYDREPMLLKLRQLLGENKAVYDLLARVFLTGK
jgi:putative phosphoesterase